MKDAGKIDLDKDTKEIATYCPPWFDARCRTWWTEQYRNNSETLTDIYKFANDDTQGLSMCVPLWGKQYPDKYYGTYCSDIKPASKSSNFL